MKVSPFVCGAALFASSFAVQAETIQVTISGEVYATNGRLELAQAARATAVVEIDTSQVVSPDPSYSSVRLNNTIVSIAYHFEDADGTPLDFGYPERFEFSEQTSSGNRFSSFTSGFYYSYNEINYYEQGERYLAYYNLRGADGFRVADYRDDFIFYTELDTPTGLVTSLFLTITPEFDREEIRLNVDRLSIDSMVVDSDADGVADENDTCLASDLSEGVSLNGIYTGVTNHSDASGCTIADYYAACTQSEQASSLLPFRPSYSGASYCQMQVGYQLYRDGLINYSELRMLRSVL